MLTTARDCSWERSANCPNAAGISASSTWTRFNRPFRHVVITDVFTDEIFCDLTTRFQQALDATFFGGEGKQFARPRGGYDAWMREVTAQDGFRPLFARAWMAGIARFMALPGNDLIDGALHHIPDDSRSGYIHTDFCSAWFDRINDGDELRFPRRDLTQYFTGKPVADGARPVEYVRSCTMIYYLNNGDWRDGAGGETALFSDMRGDGPSVRVPPVNNSMLIFECMPHSFHALQSTTGLARNSIISWLHCPVDDAERRWGASVNRRRAP